MEDAWTYEPWRGFEERVLRKVQIEMERYRELQSTYYENIGFDPELDWDTRKTARYEWLAVYQVKKWSPSKIKAGLNLQHTQAAILLGIDKAAKIIGLRVRPQKRGRARSKSSPEI